MKNKKIILIIMFLLISASAVGYYFIQQKFNIKLLATEELSDATLPTATIQTQNYKINTLYGYTQDIDMSTIHGTITPMDKNQTIIIDFTSSDETISEYKYELFTIGDYSLKETGILVPNSTSVQLKIAEVLEPNKEYLLKITLSIADKQVKYYTRIKYSENIEITKKLDFCKRFHQAALDKDPEHFIPKFLETASGIVDNSLGVVTIKSSYNNIIWANFEGNIITNIVPEVKEINDDIGVFEYKYQIQQKSTNNNNNIYNVVEIFRVRWTGTQYYLLNYKRTMSSLFNPNNISSSNKLIELGISQNLNISINHSENGSKYAFVKENEIWMFDNKKGKINKVFSFNHKNNLPNDDLFNVRIIDVTDNGDITYIVYGYITRGLYEGETGILINKYYYEKNVNEQLSFVDLPETYDVINGYISQLTYVSTDNILYYLHKNQLYKILLESGKVDVIKDNLTEGTYAISENMKLIAWQNSHNLKDSTEISIMDLETSKLSTIQAPSNERIKVLGFIQSDIIYGLAKLDYIKKKNNKLLFPMYTAEIRDTNLEIIKNYKKNNVFIIEADIVGTTVDFSRVKITKNGDQLVVKNTSKDQMMYKLENSKVFYTTKYKYSSNLLNQAVIYLDGVNIVPINIEQSICSKIVKSKKNIIQHQLENISNDNCYVYYYGRLQKITTNKPKAIQLAYENGGLVTTIHQITIWERIVQLGQKRVQNITPIQSTSKIDAAGATIKMILDYEGINVHASNLSKQKDSIYNVLNRYIPNGALDLTGIDMNYLTYYINKNIPVIVTINDGSEKEVLLVGYDLNYVSYINPKTSKLEIKTKKEFEKKFKKWGSQAVTYIK